MEAARAGGPISIEWSKLPPDTAQMHDAHVERWPEIIEIHESGGVRTNAQGGQKLNR